MRLLQVVLLLVRPLLILTKSFTYLPEDGITTLNDTTFLDTLNSSNTAWVVEFFKYTCGHCQAFAPKYIEFARNVKSWSSVVRVGAVTSDDPVWLNSHQVYGFPTIRLYLPWSMENMERLSARAPDVLTKSLLEALHLTVDHGRGLSSWPALKAVTDIEDYLAKAEASRNLLHFMVVEDEEAVLKNVGELVIMDQSSLLSNLSIHRTSMDTASPYNMTERGIYLLMGQQFVKLPGEYDRSGLNEIISNLSRIYLNETVEILQPPSTIENVTLTVTDETYIYRPAHGLQMEDILHGLRHTLWQEIAGVRSISGITMQALKDFLKLLVDYLPVDEHVTSFLSLLLGRIKNQTNISTQHWLQLLNDTKSDLAYIPEELGWKGCKGSREPLRGYPCSMWMTFHTLTVGAFNKRKELTDNKTGLYNLLTIRNYMENFFRCEECRLHFLNHTEHWLRELNHTASVWPESRAVLEFWKLHNVVNKRLHQSPLTEDPLHPKIQFPALEDCEKCRRKKPGSVFATPGTDWDFQEVFKFLLAYYSRPIARTCQERGMKVMLTPWTACSKTCGEGVSVRMSSNNSACEMKLESRLCIDKPCDLILPQVECNEASGLVQLNTPLTLNFLNCTSAPLQRWKMCGQCRNPSGPLMCCRPSTTLNRRVRFTCDGAMESTVDEDGGVWLNRGPPQSKRVRALMNVREINMCACSQFFC